MKNLVSIFLCGIFLFPITLAPAEVPITNEPSHHKVLENEYVRAFYVEVPAKGKTQIHRHDNDYIFVTLGESTVENRRVDSAPATLNLQMGDTAFTKGGFAHAAYNLDKKLSFRNITIELMKPSDQPKKCTEQSCATPIESGGNFAGKRSVLFSNNAFEVSSSFMISGSSATAQNKNTAGANAPMLFVPLTALRLTADGSVKDVKSGDVWFGSPASLTVSAGADVDAKWVVLKFLK